MKKTSIFYSLFCLSVLMTYLVSRTSAQDQITDHTPKVEVVKADQKTTLSDADIFLGKPVFAANEIPYVIYLKRTSYSPIKIDLRFKNNYRYCDKPLVGSVPSCVNYSYNDIEEVISLNLKNLPKAKEGEEEVIELRLTKSNINDSKYRVEVKHLSNSGINAEVERKFLSGGFNVDFKIKTAGE